MKNFKGIWKIVRAQDFWTRDWKGSFLEGFQLVKGVRFGRAFTWRGRIRCFGKLQTVELCEGGGEVRGSLVYILEEKGRRIRRRAFTRKDINLPPRGFRG